MTPSKRVGKTLVAVLGAATLAAAATVQAQSESYPAKPIRIIR